MPQSLQKVKIFLKKSIYIGVFWNFFGIEWKILTEGAIKEN